MSLLTLEGKSHIIIAQASKEDPMELLATWPEWLAWCAAAAGAAIAVAVVVSIIDATLDLEGN
jgi:hypothetical protein